MRKIIVFTGMILFFGVSFSLAQEEITITSYYPSPHGVYDSLLTDKLGVGDNDGVGGLTSADVPINTGEVWIAGNVGIGDIEPDGKLEVNPDGLEDNGDEFVVDSSGRVGIGTTAPGTARLTVAGGGVVVGSPTGGDKGTGTINAGAVYDDDTLLTDYVFDKYFDGKVKEEDLEKHRNYEIKTLEEMAAFIEKERHLPTMINRKEWEKEGKASLGKLVTQLWETVEIQALYIKELKEITMEQQKEIDKLKAYRNADR
ncbi:MAG: hypothetical protein ISS44_01030 [Candidatus Omnitrophica bacterium]|nr:hypothetical protein [Candidatus Omnitrophota bacterium]